MIAIRKCPRCHKIFDVVVEKTNHPYCSECWEAIKLLEDFAQEEPDMSEEELAGTETSLSPEEYSALIAAARKEREKWGGLLPNTFDDGLLNLREGKNKGRQGKPVTAQGKKAIPYGHVELDEETLKQLNELPPLEEMM